MDKGKKSIYKQLGWMAAIIIAIIVIIIIYMVNGGREKSPEKTAKKPEELTLTSIAGKEGNRVIDFAALQSVNPDVYAWIEIPGTNINYALAQSPDDPLYYLDYTYEREAGVEGAIYTEYYNGKDFTDPNTVIYGHVMKKDKTMFSQLHAYEEEAFFDKAPYVNIYLPGKQLRYEVFAAVEYDDRHLMKSIDFTDPVSFEEFLNDIRSRRDMLSHVKESVSVNASNKIITMSTCNPRDPDTRWLVTAVFIEEKAM